MAARAYVWPEKREDVIALVRPHFEAAGSFDGAADSLKKTRPQLQGVLRAHRIDWHEWIQRAPIAAPVASPKVDQAEPVVMVPVEWTGARPQTTGEGLTRRLIFTDPHVPFHSVRACAAVIAIARAIQPHEIHCLGDLFNMGAVSRHPRPLGGRENHRGAQLQGFALLDAFTRAAPGSRRRYYLGNHCEWGAQFEDEHPEFAGLLAAQWLGLDRIGWEIVPRHQQPLVLGPVDFAHGTGGGEHYAKRYALHSDTTARVHVRGHHHSMQHHRAKNGHETWGAGWLGRPGCSAFDYAKEKGHWEVGCLVQDVIGDHVTTTPVRIENGAALFGGRLVAA
jgi:hypothetical protein